MTLLACVVLCLVLCGTIEANTEKANLRNAHHLIKRQTQALGINHRQDTASYPRRQFVSPDGEPYYDYQPPVSSGRVLSQASSQVSVGGPPSGRQAKTHLGAAGPRYSATNGTGPRGRTYTYPFGREKAQYISSETQGHDQQQQQAHSSTDSEAGADWQQEAALPQRQHPLFSSSNQRPALRNSQNYSSQLPPNQQSSYDATTLNEQALRQKHDEMRRRYEDERRRHGEERRRLLDERRRQEEERRRQYYEQQQRVNQQHSQVKENNEVFQPNMTRHEHPGLTDNRRQQPSTQTDTERPVTSVDQSSQHYPHKTETTNQRGQQQGPIIPTSKVTSSSQLPERSLPHHQLPSYSSNQGAYPHQQPGLRTNSSQFPIPHNIPQQQPSFSHGYNRQSGQVDPRLQTPQESFPSSTYNRQSGQVDPRLQTPQESFPSSTYNRQSGHVDPRLQTPQESIPSSTYNRQSGQVDPRLQTPQESFPSSTYNRQSGQVDPRLQTPQESFPSSTYNRQSGQVDPRLQTPQESFPSSTYNRQSGHVDPRLQTPQESIPSSTYNRQSGQVDPRLQTPQESFPSSTSNSEQFGQSFGQGYPYQERRSNFSSSFSFEQDDSDADCPDTGIDLRINGLDCQQAVTQYGSYLCYTHEYTSRDCCHVCKPRKQMSRTGCEYGDHAELCSTIAPADCYDLRNKYSCCQTCERLRRSNLPAGCEYGDMTIKCENVRQNPGLCYIPDNKRLCCETCSQIRNVTNQGCPWGDYNPNLCQLFEENTSNVRINCYSQQRRKLCCQSCDRLKEWISTSGLPANCQYGDRPVIFTTSQFGRLTCSNLFSHFNVDECRTNEAVAINCCQTCHWLLNSRG